MARNGHSLEFLGPSSATAKGDEGVLGFNAICQATFDGSQFCNSSDILRSGNIASATSTANGMWVMPVISGFVPLAGPPYVAVDASGVVGGPDTDLSCRGWTDSTHAGLHITDEGGFSIADCATAREAACCKVTSGLKGK